MALIGAGLAQAEKPGPIFEHWEFDRPSARKYFGDEARNDFIRGGHVNVGIVFGPGRGRDAEPKSGRYPHHYPERRCDDCGYGSQDDEWRREEAKRQAEWEREESKRYYERQREADKRYYERLREDEKRFREQEREAYKRQAEYERELAKAAREADRERFKRQQRYY